jgi:hypothetical protein
VSHIRKVTASNLGVETGHPARGFREFPQFQQANARCLFNLGRKHIFPQEFQFIIFQLFETFAAVQSSHEVPTLFIAVTL